MFAVVRESTFDADKMRQGQAQIDEFFALRDRQPGYAGSVAVDAGDGRRLTLALWESEAHATAATTALQSEAERLMGPLWTTPPRVIAQGPVSSSNLVKS